jgi:hypothetical protein
LVHNRINGNQVFCLQLQCAEQNQVNEQQVWAKVHAILCAENEKAMKLIANYESVSGADQASMLLGTQGIVTHVSSRGTKSLGYIIPNIANAGLWAILDHQHADAVSFLNDNDHRVTTGLSEAELSEFNEVASSNIFNSLNKAIMVGVLLIVVMVFAVAYVGTR